MSGAEIAADIQAALIEAATDTGQGELAGNILRDGVTDESVYPPTPAEPTKHPCTCLVVEYSAFERANNTSIGVKDVRVMVAILDIVPTNADKIEIGGKPYSIMDVNTLRPGGIDLMHEIQARGA